MEITRHGDVRKRDLYFDEEKAMKENGQDSKDRRRERILQRSQAEVGIAFAYHLLVLCAYIFIHVYDDATLRQHEGKGFVGVATFSFGGRWKYLTHINMWLQLVYFALSFLTDIMPRSPAKTSLQDVCDFTFNTMAFPMATFVALTFWGIYTIDREMVYPAIPDHYIPQTLNHFWHTAILVFVVVESLLVFHPFPSTARAFAVILSFNIGYMLWSFIVRISGERWAYPFLDAMSPPLILLFFTVCFFVAMGVYFLGKKTANIRFADRHRVLESLN